MNRSKILSASALASLMAAGSAQAEMSVSGFILAAFADSDGGGMTNYNTSETVSVSYSDSLDNGMGLSIGMDITDSLASAITIDTGMGSVTFSADSKADSALDKIDGSTACYGLFWCASAYNASYNDGDEVSGDSIRYVSPSINGFTIQASMGLEGTYDNSDHTGAGGTAASPVGGSATENVDNTTSVGITGSIMGVSVKAGFADIDYNQGTHVGASTSVDQTPSMYALGYSIAGLDLGYAFYDSDDTASSEETQYGVGTSVMGMYVGAQFGAHDTTGNDTDYMTLTAVKDMGAAQFSYEYIETDVAGGTASDKDTHIFAYQIGF
jgi:hypothetical protein